MTTNDSTAADATLQAEVIRLGARYITHVDAGDAESVASLFAPEGEFILREVVHSGGAELIAFFGEAVRGIHLAGVPLVTPAAAGEVSSVQNFLFVADGSPTVVRGTYRDRIRRDEEGCVFLRRVVDLHPHQQ